VGMDEKRPGTRRHWLTGNFILTLICCCKQQFTRTSTTYRRNYS
jgi:hypothetical protein